MPEMTTEAAIIELNRLKSQERMDIDRERLIAAVDTLIKESRYRVKRETSHMHKEFGRLAGKCPVCKFKVNSNCTFCFNCGQALDWSD